MQNLEENILSPYFISNAEEYMIVLTKTFDKSQEHDIRVQFSISNLDRIQIWVVSYGSTC